MQIRFLNSTYYQGNNIKLSPFEQLQISHVANQSHVEAFLPGTKYWQFNFSNSYAECPDRETTDNNIQMLKTLVLNQGRVIGQLINYLASQRKTSS
jgi:hypothetical protein